MMRWSTRVGAVGMVMGMVMMMVALVGCADGNEVHVQWPTTPYKMVFDWAEVYPDNVVAESGPMVWIGNGTSVFYNITAIGLLQLQVGGTVYNWKEGSTECYSWSVPFDLATDWFANATALPPIPGSSSSYTTWVGSLSTAGAGLGKDSVPFAAIADKDGIPIVYSAIGVLPPQTPDGAWGNEELSRASLVYGPQDPSLFIIPSFCTSA